MELCLITDKTDFAIEAERAGVSRIMLDLERTGKALRQRGRNLFISNHIVESTAPLKAALNRASVVVRINPLSVTSNEEIATVIKAGADMIMLPYFHTLDQVRQFLSLVNGRAKTILLVETKSAVNCFSEIINEPGVDEVHIGLNDLSISMRTATIFEPLCNGLLDELSSLLVAGNIPFGFGGIARLSHTGLPVDPTRVLAEQVRLGAGVAWLGRTFRGNMETKRRSGELASEIDRINQTIEYWESATETEFMQNRSALLKQIAEWEACVTAA